MVALLAAMLLTAPPPTIAAVDGQPLAANADRLRQALANLGSPLPAATVEKLKAAGTDAKAVQEALDANVLAVVDINPESRVKVARGPADVTLRQSGFTPVLVKVINEATSKAPLKLTSPQSGPVYGGAWKNSAAETPNDPAAAGRFAQVEMHTAQPMTADLSGLKVEYAIALVYSAQAGKREITLAFDIGQGTQDLGFRAELPVLFDVAPAVPVKLRVSDFDGKPTVARFTFTDAAGQVLPPMAKRLGPDLFFQPQVYRDDGGTVLLPPGRYTMTYGRGPEYRAGRQTFALAATDKAEVNVKLERWINPADHGYYSGDHHIHAAGCAHYTRPTEGVVPEDMFLYVKGEGLNVGCALTWGPCYDHQRQFFAPGAYRRSEPFTVLKYDVEVSGFGSQALGHVCLLNLKDQTYPGSEGTKTKGWPTWTTPLMKWAKAQGAVTGYAHSANGLNTNPEKATRRLFVALDKGGKGFITPAEATTGAWPLPEPFAKLDDDGDGKVTEIELRAGTDRTRTTLPNLIIPEMNGIGAQEICVTTALGVCDFISTMDTDRVAEWNCWYHLLNCGFPLRASGETDFPCITGDRVGRGRVYVQLGKVDRIEFADWCNALAAGRSYVSDGYAHCLKFRAGTGTHGDIVDVKANEATLVTATVAFSATATAGDTSVGGRMPTGQTRKVELIVNGQVAETKAVPADGQPHDVSFDVKPERSSWVAIRSFPQMHTNPVVLRVDGKPIRASAASAKWCLGTIDQLWAVRKSAIAANERAEAEKTFQQASDVYRKIAAEAN